MIEVVEAAEVVPYDDTIAGPAWLEPEEAVALHERLVWTARLARNLDGLLLHYLDGGDRPSDIARAFGWPRQRLQSHVTALRERIAPAWEVSVPIRAQPTFARPARPALPMLNPRTSKPWQVGDRCWLGCCVWRGGDDTGWRR